MKKPKINYDCLFGNGGATCCSECSNEHPKFLKKMLECL